MIILNKNKINSWQPLATIGERNFKEVNRASPKQNTGSESDLNTVDNDALKLVTLYDAQQHLAVGTVTDMDKFLLQQCKEIDTSVNGKSAHNK